jgi:large subunit ribosomal protein L9
MEVILLENVRNLGKFGAKVNVANGFGRNFLIPQGKAVPATKQNIADFEAQRAKLEKAAHDRLLAAQERAAEISSLHLTIRARSAEEGKLFGSIGTIELAKTFKEKGIDVERQEIRLPNGPLRELGEYMIELQLHAEVIAKAKVSVVPEEEDK